MKYTQTAFIKSLSLALSLLLFAHSAPAEEVAPIPLDAFYQDIFIKGVTISPDGTHISALKSENGQTAIMVVNLDKMTAYYPMATDNQQYKINWVSWANNDRLLVSIRYDQKRGKAARLAKRGFIYTRLLALDAKQKSEPISMVSPFKDEFKWVSQYQDRIIHSLPDDKDHILLSVDREVPGSPTVYKVNVTTGKMKRIKRHSAHVDRWYADRQANVRMGKIYDKLDISFRYLNPQTDKWEELPWDFNSFEDAGTGIAGFGANPTDVYTFENHEGFRALFKVDLSKPDHPKELILSHKNRDVSGRLVYSEKEKSVVGIYYKDVQSKNTFWHPKYKKLQKQIDRALPDTVNSIIDMSEDENSYVLYSSSMKKPGIYYVGNAETNRLTEVSRRYPTIQPEQLVNKIRKTYTARDGLEIEGFLSLPNNHNNKPIATVILPHGGPVSSSGKRFNKYASYLVNKGYAVFEPNFRGSTGYGFDFTKQALGRMGLEMQDDVEDAVHFLVKEKISDPEKICIMGISYGGYSALMGAAKAPELFKCAVSIAGISDLKLLRKQYPWARYFTKAFIGEDKKHLKKASPIKFVKQIDDPILLIHGSDDTRVSVEQSRTMAKALKKAKKDFDYIELPDGSHFLDIYDNRKRSFLAIDAFFDRHLPL